MYVSTLCSHIITICSYYFSNIYIICVIFCIYVVLSVFVTIVISIKGKIYKRTIYSIFEEVRKERLSQGPLGQVFLSDYRITPNIFGISTTLGPGALSWLGKLMRYFPNIKFRGDCISSSHSSVVTDFPPLWQGGDYLYFYLSTFGCSNLAIFSFIFFIV